MSWNKSVKDLLDLDRYADLIAAHRARHGAAPTGEKESTGAL
jgi:hypothetical protein